MAKNDDQSTTGRISRRAALGRAGALAGAGIAATSTGPLIRTAAAQGDKPIRIGFQVHRTGIGAVYGRWYERTTQAAVAYINEQGGIAGSECDGKSERDNGQHHARQKCGARADSSGDPAPGRCG